MSEVSKKFERGGNQNIALPLMFAYKATNMDDFLLAVLIRIRASNLIEPLLLFPFFSVYELLKRILKLTGTRRNQMEIICRVVLIF